MYCCIEIASSAPNRSVSIASMDIRRLIPVGFKDSKCHALGGATVREYQLHILFSIAPCGSVPAIPLVLSGRHGHATFLLYHVGPETAQNDPRFAQLL
jgi:hypothetical protein